MQDLWLSYKREQNRYNTMLRFKKQHSLFTLIKENSDEARKLYKLISQLTGQKEDNLLPEDDSIKPAEQFIEFFLSKIISIRKKIHNIPSYKTQEDTIPRFDKFSTMSEADLKQS